MVLIFFPGEVSRGLSQEHLAGGSSKSEHLDFLNAEGKKDFDMTLAICKQCHMRLKY